MTMGWNDCGKLSRGFPDTCMTRIYYHVRVMRTQHGFALAFGVPVIAEVAEIKPLIHRILCGE